MISSPNIGFWNIIFSCFIHCNIFEWLQKVPQCITQNSMIPKKKVPSKYASPTCVWYWIFTEILFFFLYIATNLVHGQSVLTYVYADFSWVITIKINGRTFEQFYRLYNLTKIWLSYPSLIHIVEFSFIWFWDLCPICFWLTMRLSPTK